MIMRSVPISKPKVKEFIEKERWGLEMITKVPLDTIVNRIKYERRIYRGSREGQGLARDPNKCQGGCLLLYVHCKHCDKVQVT